MPCNPPGSLSGQVRTPEMTSQCRLGEDLEVEFFVELGQFLAGGGGERLRRHDGEDAVVAVGVVAQGLAQWRGHQRGVACQVCLCG